MKMTLFWIASSMNEGRLGLVIKTTWLRGKIMVTVKHWLLAENDRKQFLLTQYFPGRQVIIHTAAKGPCQLNVNKRCLRLFLDKCCGFSCEDCLLKHVFSYFYTFSTQDTISKLILSWCNICVSATLG